VLVVDDEPDILLLIKMALQVRGYRVSLAADGETALQCLKEGSWDAVILDLAMPVLDGWGVLARVQLLPTRPDVLVLSATMDSANRQRAMALGAAACMAKPFGLEELVSTLDAFPGMADIRSA
jgi:DNA-binding response OmpR family regulator